MTMTFLPFFSWICVSDWCMLKWPWSWDSTDPFMFIYYWTYHLWGWKKCNKWGTYWHQRQALDKGVDCLVFLVFRSLCQEHMTSGNTRAAWYQTDQCRPDQPVPLTCHQTALNTQRSLVNRTSVWTVFVCGLRSVSVSLQLVTQLPLIHYYAAPLVM